MEFRSPLPGAVLLSPFGMRRRRYHEGIDLRLSRRGGEPVRAAAAGRVVETQDRGGYGRQVLIEHPNGWFTRYAHLRAVKVRLGQEVAMGAVVGTVGRSGNAPVPHLHFELRLPDKRPIDPGPYIFKK